MKLKHHHQLRGPRYRAVRRQIRRGISNEHVTFMGNDEFAEVSLELKNEILKTIGLRPMEIDIHKCHVCGAKGDDPCVTKSGNRAKQNHAGKDTF